MEGNLFAEVNLDGLSAVHARYSAVLVGYNMRPDKSLLPSYSAHRCVRFVNRILQVSIDRDELTFSLVSIMFITIIQLTLIRRLHEYLNY